MKSIINGLSRMTWLLGGLLVSLYSRAQEKSADIDVDINAKDESNWYTQPWVWVVGAAVFILLLVALLRGGKARE